MSIHQEIVFDVTPDRLYEAYMDSAKHAAFTGNGEAEISRDAGGTFSCHGGAIHGRHVELVENERIVQAWRVANWEPGVFSIVKIDLRAEGDDKTRLVLEHAGVPEDQVPHIGQGWHDRYWKPLAEYFG